MCSTNDNGGHEARLPERRALALAELQRANEDHEAARVASVVAAEKSKGAQVALAGAQVALAGAQAIMAIAQTVLDAAQVEAVKALKSIWRRRRRRRRRASSSKRRVALCQHLRQASRRATCSTSATTCSACSWTASPTRSSPRLPSP